MKIIEITGWDIMVMGHIGQYHKDMADMVCENLNYGPAKVITVDSKKSNLDRDSYKKPVDTILVNLMNHLKINESDQMTILTNVEFCPFIGEGACVSLYADFDSCKDWEDTVFS